MKLDLPTLLARGYFPKELPPPFSTQAYADESAGPAATIPGSAVNTGKGYSACALHRLVRYRGVTRTLSIPNPLHYYRLCYCVVQHWKALNRAFGKSPLSLTMPVVAGTERALLPIHTLSERTEIRASFRSTKRFMLTTDVSRFYPSVYTHSIPWALMGKKRAKSAYKRKVLTGTWQDELDALSRGVNQNQTIGLPIGPDTSLVIAECILSRIDTELFLESKPKPTGLRYIDDYELYFNRRSQAEKTLSIIQEILNDYELAPNPHKTRIIELPTEIDTPQVSKLRVYTFRHSAIGQKHDLTDYFNRVFQYRDQGEEENLFKYAIARLKGENIAEDNLRYVEDILAQCVLAEPSCMPQVFHQIHHYLTLGFRPSKRVWGLCLNTVVAERTPLRHSSEAAWAMWMMKVLRVKLSAAGARAAASTDDCVVALMALGLASEGLGDAKLLHDLKRFRDADELYGPQWLLCYEGNLKGWFGRGRNRLNSDPFFAFLAARGVSFFDIGTRPTAPDRWGPPLSGAGGGAY